jgi:hypothetical protein
MEELQERSIGGIIMSINTGNLGNITATKEIIKVEGISFTINYAGFSVNSAYVVGNMGKMVCSKPLLEWIKDFPVDQVPCAYDLLTSGVDLRKPLGMKLSLPLRKNDGTDLDNMSKKMIDQLFTIWNTKERTTSLVLDDSIIKQLILEVGMEIQYWKSNPDSMGNYRYFGYTTISLWNL